MAARLALGRGREWGSRSVKRVGCEVQGVKGRRQKGGAETYEGERGHKGIDSPPASERRSETARDGSAGVVLKAAWAESPERAPLPEGNQGDSAASQLQGVSP